MKNLVQHMNICAKFNVKLSDCQDISLIVGFVVAIRGKLGDHQNH